MSRSTPHPVPYQGSKRKLASRIIGAFRDRSIGVLYDPFCGSAALTIAAASAGIASRYIIGDSLLPLTQVWETIIGKPLELATAYNAVWQGQKPNDDGYYDRVRARFNADHAPADLLYILARCVKNSPRWNQSGQFNQGVDRRRLGMAPEKMRREIVAASELLHGKTTVVCADFETTINDATQRDIVYLDPPYQGTSDGANSRYHRGLDRSRLIDVLERMNLRGVPWILSYDGRCGGRAYGSPLPRSLYAYHVELEAGRSSQSTLNGVEATTVESLYVSGSVRNLPMK